MAPPRRPTSMLVRAALTPVVLTVAYFTLPFSGRNWPVAATYGLIATAVVVPMTARRIGRIRTSEHPVAEALMAVSMMLSLLIIAFATGYYVLANHTDQFPGIHTRIDSLYFTMATVGTVGYGDITPVGQGARVLVSAHILVNLTLIGGSIRLLVSAAQERRRVQTE